MNTPRGMRDFPPEEKIGREEVISTLKKVFELYGFSPLETPALERWDVLSAKYAGGAEILKETFKLEDQGKRQLGLRYDLTVPLARFIAMNRDVKLPFKRYQIEKVYRDGPIKLGRYREFYQCDVDIVGADSPLADAQCLQVALSVFTELGLPVKITVNDIGVLKGLLQEAGFKDIPQAMLVLDKLKKIGREGVKEELKDVEGDIDKVLSQAENPDEIEATRLRETLSLVNDPRVEFDPSMSRGLTYYTGIVFEAFTEGKVKGSLCGGGRYDDMIGGFTNSKDSYPAVGISFGLEPIMDSLERDSRKTVTEVLIIPIKTENESSELAERLREKGIRSDIDILDRSLSKNLDYANQMGIPLAIILGKRDLDEGVCTLKDMESGDEEKVPLDGITDRIRERE